MILVQIRRPIQFHLTEETVMLVCHELFLLFIMVERDFSWCYIDLLNNKQTKLRKVIQVEHRAFVAKGQIHPRLTLSLYIYY